MLKDAKMNCLRHEPEPSIILPLPGKRAHYAPNLSFAARSTRSYGRKYPAVLRRSLPWGVGYSRHGMNINLPEQMKHPVGTSGQLVTVVTTHPTSTVRLDDQFPLLVPYIPRADRRTADPRLVARQQKNAIHYMIRPSKRTGPVKKRTFRSMAPKHHKRSGKVHPHRKTEPPTKIVQEEQDDDVQSCSSIGSVVPPPVVPLGSGWNLNNNEGNPQ